MSSKFTYGTRVRIRSPKGLNGMREFEGKTGTVVGVEMDGQTKMVRVRLDTPVEVEHVGTVHDDLWAGKFLQVLR